MVDCYPARNGFARKEAAKTGELTVGVYKLPKSPICNNEAKLQYRARLTLKAQTKIAADDILIFYFYLSKKIRLDVSCESSA